MTEKYSTGQALIDRRCQKCMGSEMESQISGNSDSGLQVHDKQ